MKKIKETNIAFVNNDIFGGNMKCNDYIYKEEVEIEIPIRDKYGKIVAYEPVTADCYCYDGVAIAIDGERRHIVLTYPKLKTVLEMPAMSLEVRLHCGISRLGEENINYGDIMLKYGIVKEIK